MVSRRHVSQRHGHVLIDVVHVLLQVTFFRTVVVHHVCFKINVTLRVDVEADGRVAMFDFAVLQIGNGDGLAHLRFLLFIGDGNGFQRAALFHEYAVGAVNRADVTGFIFNTDADIALSGVDLLRQIVRPLVSVALFSRADGHFGTHGGHFTVGVEEACDNLIAHVQVITGNLAAKGFAPFGNDRRRFVRGYVATIPEINVNGLIKAI